MASTRIRSLLVPRAFSGFRRGFLTASTPAWHWPLACGLKPAGSPRGFTFKVLRNKWTTPPINIQRALFRTSSPDLSEERGELKSRGGHLSPTKQSVQNIKSFKSKVLPITPHENIYNVPNALTFGRLLASPVIGYLILHDQHAAALSLFAVAGVTDLVDGWIARRWNLQTVVGSVIDPMADKTLMAILTMCLAAKGLLPVWIAVIILGRDVLLAIAAIYFRWISLPPPKTMARYWDFSLPSAEVHPTTISKLNTALQLGLIGACMANPLVGQVVDWEVALQAMQYTVATTTVGSGLSYVFSKDAVKILKHP